MELIERIELRTASWADFKRECRGYFFSTKEIEDYISVVQETGSTEDAVKQYLENKQKENNMNTKNTECDVKSNTNITTEIDTVKIAYATKSKDVVGMVTDSYKEISALIDTTVITNTEALKLALQSELKAERAELEKEFAIKELELANRDRANERDYEEKEKEAKWARVAFEKETESCNDKRVKEGVKSGLKVAVAEATKSIESDRLDTEVKLDVLRLENKALTEKLINYSEGMEIDFLLKYFRAEQSKLGIFGDSDKKEAISTIILALFALERGE